MPLGFKLVNDANDEYILNGKTKTATIASGAALSGEIDLEGYLQGAIITPSTWTAAAITFVAASVSGGTFVPVRDSYGNEVSIPTVATGAANSYAVPAEVMTHNVMKIQSGVTGATVNQAAARTLSVVLK